MHDAQKVRFWIAAAAITAINVALWVGSGLTTRSGPILVRVAGASSAGEFEDTGRLSMRFDRDVYTREQVENQLQFPPFHIDPELPGQWTVRSEDEVAFEPDMPPPPGQVYRVGIDENHRFFDTIAIESSDLPEIHYKPLHVQGARLVLTHPAEDPIHGAMRRATIELAFNQDVSRADLQEHLRVRVGGNAAEAAFDGEALAQRHRFDVLAQPGTSIGLNIDSALSGHTGELGLARPFTGVITVPRGLHMSRIDANRYWWDSARAEIQVRFDRNLSSGQKTPHIEITPSPGPMHVRISGNRIVIKANFADNADYTVSLDPPLIAADGSVLQTGFTSSVRVPAGRPHLAFPRSMGRLGTRGAFELDLDASRLETARLRIHRLLPRHIPIYLSGVMYQNEVPRLGQKIAEKTIDLPCKDARSQRIALDLDQVMERQHGIYLVSIESTERRWTRDSMLLFVGDLGIEVKTDSRGMTAWVTDVETGMPLAGAEVVAWKTNRTELDQGTTDGYGLLRLDATTRSCDLVTAQLGEQIIFVDPREAQGLDDRALGGANWSGPLDVALYAERGVHRPGATIHLTGVVRTRDGAIPGRIPLEIRVTRPDNRVIHSEIVHTDPEQGMLHVDVETQADSPSGNWLCSAHVPGKKDAIARINCPVMPFVPVRLAVEASTIATDSTMPEVSVGATYLHGAPATGLAVKLATDLKPVRYRNTRFEDFRFEDPPTTQHFKQAAEATLGEDGRTTFQLNEPKVAGTWRGQAQATVLELGGRPSTTRTPIDIDTAQIHLGLRLPDGELYRTHESITVEAILLDESAEPTGAGMILATVDSIDHEWNLVDADNGRREWRSIEIVRPIENLAPNFVTSEENHRRCVIPPLPPGTYRFSAMVPARTGSSDPPTLNTLQIHVSDRYSRGRIAAERPDRIEIIPQDPKVVPGMETSVLLRPAFPGLALVTVETDHVQEARVISIPGDGARFPFTVPLDARDTCFIGATIIRPLDATRSQWLPIRARGAARLQIDRTEKNLDVFISASEQARPGDKVRVMVSVPGARRQDENTSAPAMLHVWAVEEGALLVTDHHAPTLLDHFLRDRRRMVAAAGSSQYLLPDYTRPVTVQRIGGDASRRFREPVPSRIEQAAVIWQTVAPLPADGRNELDMEMPRIDGAMRIMAAVVDGDRYGSGEHVIGVVAPIQVLAATPRAAAPGDRMAIPVRVRNNTSEPVELDIDADLGESLRGALDAERLTVPANDVGHATLTMVAGQPGSARVRISATPAQPAPRLQTQVLERWIAVRPPHGRDRSVVRLEAKPGARVQLDRDRSLEALAGHVEVVLGGHPAIDLKPVLDGLIQYPYGCGEQTSSRTRGMLAALSLPEEITGRNTGEIRSMIDAGISRLWWMQRSDGSIPYWRGGDASDWLTLRSALLALDARDSGFTLPVGFLDALLERTETIARPRSGQIDTTMAAHACRVLARADAPDEALMASTASRLKTLDQAGRAHLADAFYAIGDLDQAQAIVEEFHVPQAIPANDTGRFTSGVHQAAVTMDVLLRNQPDDPSIAAYAHFINESRNASGWSTTFENAAVLNALCNWHARRAGDGTASGRIRIAGRDIEFHGNTPVRHAFDIPPGGSGGEEFLDSLGDGPVSLLISTSGVPINAGPTQAMDSIIEIKRTWLDATDTVIEPGTPLDAGDLVTVELEVRSRVGAEFANVAIVDVLPGGMEFELPTLVTSAGRDKVKLDSVDRVEFRDDRLIAFSPVTTTPRRIRYLLRAVVPGEWAVPAADALAMYNPDAHGRTASSRVEITLP